MALSEVTFVVAEATNIGSAVGVTAAAFVHVFVFFGKAIMIAI
jgi:hypothetical protein